jgi:acyl-coenzyme A thioesterase PaaI-like protein
VDAVDSAGAAEEVGRAAEAADSTDGRAAYGDLVSATRRLQDALAAARPPAALSRQLASSIAAIAAQLEPLGVAEEHRLSGRLAGPGRGQAFVPPLYYGAIEADRVDGEIEFSPFHVGTGAVHGGAPALIFDEVFGRLAAAGGRPMSRTAYLHVNYRRITPISTRLRFEVRIDRVEGRKLFMTGTLEHQGEVLCDAECLYVILRADQP